MTTRFRDEASGAALGEGLGKTIGREESHRGPRGFDARGPIDCVTHDVEIADHIGTVLFNDDGLW